MGTQLNGSILKAFDILNLFSEHRLEITTMDVSSELKVNKVTANRLLRTMEETGALIPKSKGVYRLGFLFVNLAEQVQSHQNLAQNLHPFLANLANDLNEATMLAVYEGAMVTVIDMVKPLSGQSLTVEAKKGARMEAYCTSQGKIWLASLTEAQIDNYLKKKILKPLTKNTITDVVLLKDQLKEVRACGYAVNREESAAGLVTIAVPFTGPGKRMLAGISVFGPAARMTEEFVTSAIEALIIVSGEAQKAIYGNSVN